MMIRRVGRSLPSLFRFGSSSPYSVAAASIVGRSSPSLLGLSSVQGPVTIEHDLDHGLGGISRAAIFSFSRGFAVDALTAHDDSMPPTLAALKNPTNCIVYDERVHERYAPGDPSKRAFTYFLFTGGRFAYAAAVRLTVIKFILSMSASKDVLAMASLEVNLETIEPGATVTVKWRGKPVFIRRRTESDIKLANSTNIHELRDPQTDSERVQVPEWLIVVGVCTHLGCVPLPNAGDYGGWFCPCHGSHYDISGRIRKGPAPYNLEVPTYKFMEEGKVLIG